MSRVRDHANELERIARDLRRDEVRRLHDEEKMTFAAIGARLGISRQRAQQLYETSAPPETQEVPA